MPQNPARRILFVLCLTIFPPVAAISSSSRQEKQITNYGRDRAVHPLDRNPASKENISFFPVAYLSAMNSIVNVIRPDASIIWQARLPRVLWEVCIAIVAASANASNPSMCLLLCLMMVPTALVDIFVWAPSFALFARFETCTGGGIISRQPRVCTSDYVKGIGRLFVSAQSLLTGVFYLYAAVVSWTVFAESRDKFIAQENAKAIGDKLADGR